MAMRQQVAPYVGAWIETNLVPRQGSRRAVAPYVGAWIETQDKTTYHDKRYVAPYVGAWIETYVAKYVNGSTRSHPTWVRGLKQQLR